MRLPADCFVLVDPFDHLGEDRGEHLVLLGQSRLDAGEACLDRLMRSIGAPASSLLAGPRPPIATTIKRSATAQAFGNRPAGNSSIAPRINPSAGTKKVQYLSKGSDAIVKGQRRDCRWMALSSLFSIDSTQAS